MTFMHRLNRELPEKITDLTDVFGILCKSNENINIYVVHQLPPFHMETYPNTPPQHLGLSINYMNSETPEREFISKNYIDIPIELNREILKFLSPIYLNIDIVIKFPSEYPFVPPKCYLVDIRSNHPNLNKIKEFIKYKIMEQNRYDSHFPRQWSPAVGIVNYILTFIIKINCFQELLTN